MLVVINIEDVLAPGRDLRTIASYRGASVFYEAMASQYQLIALTMADEEIARWWLKRERMPKWAQVYAADAIANRWDAADFQDWQYATVRGLLAEGWEIAFYVDVLNGNLTERMHNMGVTTMTMRRNTTIPGWRNPETSAPRAWDTLVVDS